MTGIAAQLAQNASLNTAFLVDRSRRKPRDSYLFTGRDAEHHDTDSLHALGLNGLIQLSELNPSLRIFENILFSEQAKSTDRTLLTSDANAQLNKSIAAFLSLLGPYLLESPTGKVLEWLIKRFRINEFNVEDILALFLPYHETSHFAKMVTILHIKPNSTWSFLLPYKSAGQSLPRLPLVTEMLKNTDVSRFIASLLPSSLKDKRAHRVLLTFNAACLHDFITRSKRLDEGTVAFLLPALLSPLKYFNYDGVEDGILGAYVLLAAFSKKCQLSGSALKTIITAMTNGAPYVNTRQFLIAAIAVCEPQEQLERLSEKTSLAVLNLSLINTELCNTTKLTGFDKLFCPLLKGLAKRMEDEATGSLMSSLLTYPAIPTPVIEQITNSALQHILGSGTSQASLRPLLSSIHQRHPNILRSVSDQMIKDGVAVETELRQLLISLPLDGLTTGSKHSRGEQHTMVVASMNAEPNVRLMGMKGLIEALSNPTLSDSLDIESIKSALISRIQDTDTQVLEALYEKPSVILPVFLKNTNYVETLVQCLCSETSKPTRHVLRMHFNFLINTFCPQADQATVTDVFYRVLFPFLLFSKPRQRTADMVWDILKEDSTDLSYMPLNGCAAVVEEEKSNGGDIIDMMSNLNMKITEKIARNVLASNEYTTHLELTAARLQDKNPHAQILAHLILQALLKQLSGEHQINAAYKTLHIMGADQPLNVQNLAGTGDLYKSLEDGTMGKQVIVKPSSKNTLLLLRAAIISFIPSVSPPHGVSLDFTADLSATSMDVRGQRYVELMRTIYFIANTCPLQTLSLGIIRSLFISLKDDVLAFLAGIWSGADKHSREDDQLRSLALQHAAAFFQAHINEDDGVDYQTILPLILVALDDQAADVRQAAIICLSHLRTLAERKLVSVYKFDAIYGTSNRQLQYLDQNDLKKYLDGLNGETDHLAHDNSFIRLFHERYLKKTKTDKRKESGYKHRVHCYLLSHVHALSLPSAQIVLLKITQNVPDAAKARLLSPIIEQLVESPPAPHDSILEELTGLCLTCFDSSVSRDLSDPESTLWDLYVSALCKYFASGVSPRLRAAVSLSLEKGLFTALSQERRISVCELLLEIGANDLEMYDHCKKLLASLVTEVLLIIHLLGLLQPSSIDPGSRANKRARTTESVDANNTLRRLMLLVEVLGTKPLPGSLDLISQLLEMLNRVSQCIPSALSDVSYIEQMLMSAVESAAEKITEIPNLAPSAVRLDILVELIRVSDNRQTFHQALLLISKLSRLAPDSVLHNIMPVFTFMGSNVFHRDDTYSFKVVQQTIESIVPIMVSSLKQSHTDKLDLHIASRDFLRVFTDAANHIPRHRRNNFFSHLVDVLGPADFLAPICMLLVEKSAKRVVRQSPEDAQATLSLPIAVVQHNPASMHLSTFTEILHESQRLVNSVINPTANESTFLDDSIDDNSSRPIILKKRAKALISFVGIVLTSVSPSGLSQVSNDEEMSGFITTLLNLVSLKNGPDPERKMDEIRQVAAFAMTRALSTMAAASFIRSIVVILDSQEGAVQSGALDLFSERLPMVADVVREAATPGITSIIEKIRVVITSLQDTTLVQSAYRALRSICLTLQKGEEGSIAKLVPPMLSAVKNRNSSSQAALTSLSSLSTKLGPRIIPYLQEMVSLSVEIISNETGAMVEDAHSVLHALLLSISAFWSNKEVMQVITMFTKYYTPAQTGRSKLLNRLIKIVTKTIPSKTLLKSAVEMWPTYKKSDKVAAYFDLLTRILRSSNRPVVSEFLRQLVKVFLESLDVAVGTDAQVESLIISAFKQLVVKLNDAAFKPIFRRIYDWAYAGEPENAKKIVFCHLYADLLDFFKGLMTPYMSFLLNPLVHDLESFGKSALQDRDYWVAVLDIVNKSLKFDDGAFWRDDKLRQFSKPIIAQVPVCISWGSGFTTATSATSNKDKDKQLLHDCLSSLVDTATDDTLLKSLNLDLLMHTRSDDTRLRIYALTCAEMLWRNHGGKLLGFVAETATFIAECNEDDNDIVVKESLKLKNAVESVAGSINGL
ncbi:hypothetical protein AMATHDRAFT_155738 [Amanita thiersii Skay4041]|uniref:U3 small nucleolar RNA-associated protein 10 n=1 Tax=Amanita thiersii Skay4041 TaxID=703135 RepID=A0A2A9NEU9_9AGAR|nr:hypothetical protein AMATHDRAFT_155738 [Amanita thiersii Skay4041]